MGTELEAAQAAQEPTAAAEAAVTALSIPPAGVIVDATSAPAMVRLHMGDVVFCLDSERLERMLRATMPVELGGLRKPPTPRTSAEARQAAALEVVAMGLRGAAIAALPVVRKVMQTYAPTYPAPQPPRRSDVLAYLMNYFIRLVRDLAERTEWNLGVSETEAGEIEIINISPLRPADASAAPREAQTGRPTRGDDPRSGQ